MKINAYGKINLTLDVVGRREDGYHLLDTVMQTISVWDELEIQHSRQPGVHLQCNRESLPTDSKNTAFRAAKFFLEDRGLQNEGVYIFIKKHIPSRSGMGGGSADAAAVLRGLNEMYETKLSAEKLMELGVKVGADVPFCVIGGAARCTGTGAQVEPIAPMPECWLVVCKPPTGMSTPRAYALLDQYPLSSVQATPRMLEAMAVAAGFNPEGGTKNYSFSTRDSHSELCGAMRLIRGWQRPGWGYFLRAESFYNVATQEELYAREGRVPSAGLHERSHGESFLTVAQSHLRPQSLYFLDEPEAALSPQRQLTLLLDIHSCAAEGSQFFIVTHSPILLGFPGAEILSFDGGQVHPLAYEETDSFRVTKMFIERREQVLKELLGTGPAI